MVAFTSRWSQWQLLLLQELPSISRLAEHDHLEVLKLICLTPLTEFVWTGLLFGLESESGTFLHRSRSSRTSAGDVVDIVVCASLVDNAPRRTSSVVVRSPRRSTHQATDVYGIRMRPSITYNRIVCFLSHTWGFKPNEALSHWLHKDGRSSKAELVQNSELRVLEPLKVPVMDGFFTKRGIGCIRPSGVVL